METRVGSSPPSTASVISPPVIVPFVLTPTVVSLMSLVSSPVKVAVGSKVSFTTSPALAITSPILGIFAPVGVISPSSATVPAPPIISSNIGIPVVAAITVSPYSPTFMGRFGPVSPYWNVPERVPSNNPGRL